MRIVSPHHRRLETTLRYTPLIFPRTQVVGEAHQAHFQGFSDPITALRNRTPSSARRASRSGQHCRRQSSTKSDSSVWRAGHVPFHGRCQSPHKYSPSLPLRAIQRQFPRVGIFVREGERRGSKVLFRRAGYIVRVTLQGKPISAVPKCGFWVRSIALLFGRILASRARARGVCGRFFGRRLTVQMQCREPLMWRGKLGLGCGLGCRASAISRMWRDGRSAQRQF